MTNHAHDLSPPDITPNFPSRGKKLSAAWADLWAQMSTEDYQDGQAMAEEVAERHQLAKDSLLTLLSQAAKVGLLERTHAVVAGTRGPRQRSHYRVHQEFVTKLREVFASSDQLPYAAEYTGKGKG